MSNNPKQPGGLEYQPAALNTGQDAAGAVSQSGQDLQTQATGDTAAGPQPPRRAIIRRATLPGQDATGDSLSNPAGPGLLDIVAGLQKAAAPFAVPDIVAGLQKTASKYNISGIAAALQKVTSLQDAALLQVKTAAAVCISINATPAGIIRQIDYFARLRLSYIGEKSAGRGLTKANRFAADIRAYFLAELETNPYYFDIVAQKEAAEKAAERAKAENEATAAELDRCQAELSLFEAAGYYIEIHGDSVTIGRRGQPQPESKARTPRPLADFKLKTNRAYLKAVYKGLPPDFKPKEALFYALLENPKSMPAPIRAKPGQVAAFFHTLLDTEVQFIGNKQFAAIAEQNKCFVNIDGRPMKAKNISQALARILHDSQKPLEDFEYIKEIAKKPPYLL